MIDLFGRLRDNFLFQGVVVFVILASAFNVGASTYDDVPKWVSNYLGIADTLVTVFFAVEISIRFIAEERKYSFLRDPWNLFDSLIVGISLVPAELTGSVMLLRLIRIFRVMRLISVVPELRRMIEALLISLKRGAYVLLLMFIAIYIYAAFGAILFADIDPERWADIGLAAITLTQVMTLSSWEDVMKPIQAVYGFAWIYFFSYIFMMAFIFVNLLIGISVDALRVKVVDDDEAGE
jgi:voltage-gated sodium channel